MHIGDIMANSSKTAEDAREPVILKVEIRSGSTILLDKLHSLFLGLWYTKVDFIN